MNSVYFESIKQLISTKNVYYSTGKNSPQLMLYEYNNMQLFGEKLGKNMGIIEMFVFS